jgi:3alpha(or 20beta)-hydroxysteroid dehydrogenase
VTENPRFSGKVALVSGGAGGIGSAIVRALVRQGASVVIGDTADSAGPGLASELGRKSLFHELDVTVGASWLAALDAADTAYGPVTVLVHCAGAILVRAIAETTSDEFSHQYSVNVLGPFLGTQAAAKTMGTAGGGTVLIISSRAGTKGTAWMSAYAASKAASVNFARSAAMELAGLGIRVNAITPGGIDTPMSRAIAAHAAGDKFSRLPVPRIGVPGDIVPLALLLLSDESSYITGAVVAVDGGASAG